MEKLELELAACLRRLLRHRYLIRSRNEKWFKNVIEHRNRLQEIVETFGAYLEINEPLGVIYLRTLSEEVDEQLGIRFSRPKVLGPYASALMLHLRWQRMQFYTQPTGDDVPIISLLEMRDFLQPFSQAKVDIQFERIFRRCIDELVELQVLLETGTDSGFYEISSLCDLLLPSDQIHELRARAEAYFSRESKDSAMSHQGDL
jgi:hypothetical protein